MADQFTGNIIADKYRIDSLVRNGDLGGIYHGRHLFMDKPVTVKLLSASQAADEGTRKRFSAEARNATLISHPNILAVSDFGTQPDGSVYIVFEGFEGGTLKDAIAHGGMFAAQRAGLIARQIASALATAHAKGILHGNLSPESVVLTGASNEDETAKVYDFGSSSGDDSRSSKNIAYLSPEHFSGLGNTDARSDVYSLGVIFYQMLAGQLPFTGETPMDVMLKHVEEPPAPLTEFRQVLPAMVEAVAMKALAKDPDERYQTADEFVEDLEGLSLHLENPTAESRNNIWKTAFIVLAGISVLAAALIFATSVKRTDPTTQLQPDANGQPVQPINPATGVEEQTLAAMPVMLPGEMSNTNMMAQPPGTLPGGDGYNPWGSGGAPPPGAPMQTYVAPGGQVYTIDPNNPSQFMPMDGGVVLVPVPANTNTAVKPTPTPKIPAANANTAVAATPPPTVVPKPSPTPAKPAATPARTPAVVNKPEAGENQKES